MAVGKNSDTQHKALDSLEKIALEKGLDALSMRDVAKGVDISLAALQYHFPTKADLFRAFIERTVDQLEGGFEGILTSSQDQPKIPLLVRYMLDETVDNDQGALITMIWTRALHDDVAASSAEELTNVYLAGVKEIVSKDHPNISAEQITLAATLIASLLDGFTATYAAAVKSGMSPKLIANAASDVASEIPKLVARCLGKDEVGSDL